MNSILARGGEKGGWYSISVVLVSRLEIASRGDRCVLFEFPHLERTDLKVRLYV